MCAAGGGSHRGRGRARSGGLGLWAPGRRGDEGGCLEERNRRPGGLEQEADGGGGGPSPAADEELRRLSLSLPIWTGGMVDWGARQP
jgi:hypothetical protein